jgi:hypothetical protein
MCRVYTQSLDVTGGNEGKDTKLSPHEQRMLNHLQKGGEWSAKDLMQVLPDRDPRSTIRYLRGKGYPIGDRWDDTGESSYKMYFLRQFKSTKSSTQLNLFDNNGGI